MILKGNVFEFKGARLLMVQPPARADGKRFKQTLDKFSSSWAEGKGEKLVATINGSLFSNMTTEAKPYGTLASRSEQGFWINKPYPSPHWIALIYNGDKMIVSDNMFTETMYPDAHFIIGGISCTVRGHIDKRSQIDTYYEHTNRTIVGQKADGTCVFACFKGNVLKTRLYAQELGLYNSIILDGGGSTGMIVEDELIYGNKNRPICNALLVYSKEEVTVIDDKTFDFDEFLGLQLTKNFSMKELSCKNDNEVYLTRDVLEHAKRLQKLRDKFGPLAVNSWLRTTEHNRAVGGSKNSTHLLGIGTDLKVPDGRRQSQIADYWDKLMDGHGGIGKYDTFIHLDSRDGRWREDYRT